MDKKTLRQIFFTAAGIAAGAVVARYGINPDEFTQYLRDLGNIDAELIGKLNKYCAYGTYALAGGAAGYAASYIPGAQPRQG